MHIAFLCQPFDTARPPTPNSLGLWVYEVARRLPADWRVTIYTRAGGRRPRTERAGRLCYRMIPIRYDAALARLMPANDEVPPFARASTHLLYATAAALDMRRSGVDVVHAINFSQFAPILRRLVPDARIVLNMVCEWLSQLEPSIVEPRLQRTDAVMGCSDYITDLVRARFPRAPIRFYTVGNGVDAASMRPADTGQTPSRRILFVGRVSPEKGVHTLIEAMTPIVRQFPDAVLDVVGGRSQLPRSYLVDLAEEPIVRDLGRFYDGEDRMTYARTLDEMVRAAELQNNVVFHDSVPYETVSAYYARSAVLVNPSLSESFGRSLIEAMASAVPVVATRIGGMPEIMSDGREGLLVEPERSDLLAAAIVRLLGDPAGARKMGVAGRQTVLERFTWEEIASNATAVYSELYGGTSGGD